MAAQLHPAAPHHLPPFITAPHETDAMMVLAGVIIIGAVLGFGLLFLRLHTLPERMAHKAHKLQFEIVAVLGLLALFTHIHLFWVAGLLLALIEIPDVWNPLRRMAGALDKIAGIPPERDEDEPAPVEKGGGHPPPAATASPATASQPAAAARTAQPEAPAHG
ncbi:hypothetical protein [Bosea sp. (in: a-proteobacteria)]|uniref:hypothetical protein n=1 Tax=Bosea sp. (in: a-proteobacteria) TaxID=1871050 RepID=UPI0027349289|nr:hypothetical protein [Bosea sp. (in: a-proteobacteria)]MDP3409678.1 hypothetical protein [Bosea sp. (in: a-proteobacteria)]